MSDAMFEVPQSRLEEMSAEIKRLRAEVEKVTSERDALRVDADCLAAALKLCQPYAEEDFVDENGNCPYCGGDGEGQHKGDCAQVEACFAGRKALRSHYPAEQRKGW